MAPLAAPSSPGAPDTHPTAPLLWCVGTKLAAAGGGGDMGVKRHSSGRAVQQRLLSSWRRASGRPICGGQMRIIAFISHSADIQHMLDHIGVDSEAPHIAPARGRRCGMTAIRRRVMAAKSGQIGTWQHHRYRSTRSINASTGRGGSQRLRERKQRSPRGLACQNRRYAGPHAVEFPTRHKAKN